MNIKPEVKVDIASLYSCLQPNDLVSFPTFFPTISQYPLPCFQCYFPCWSFAFHVSDLVVHTREYHIPRAITSCYILILCASQTQLFFYLENILSGISKEPVWIPSPQKKQRVVRVLIYFLASNTNLIGTRGCLISLYSKSTWKKRCGVEKGETTAKDLSNLLSDIFW